MLYLAPPDTAPLALIIQAAEAPTRSAREAATLQLLGKDDLMTPYQRHAAFGHKTTWHSPNGVDKVEECADCGQRWLYQATTGWVLTLSPLADLAPAKRIA